MIGKTIETLSNILKRNLWEPNTQKRYFVNFTWCKKIKHKLNKNAKVPFVAKQDKVTI